MRYWDLFDLMLRNIYAYAKKEYDVELLDVFAVFRWSFLKMALIMAIEKVDPDKIPVEEYIEEVAKRFKETLRKAKWIGVARKLEEEVHEGVQEVYEKYERKAEEETLKGKGEEDEEL